MSYAIEILRRAQKQLARLPRQDYERVRDEIRSLAKVPRPPGCRKLKARDGWRLRVGDYRVIYEIRDTVRIITVLEVGHRKDIYR